MIKLLTKNKIAIFALLFILIITNYHTSLVFADPQIPKLGDQLSTALNTVDPTAYNCHCDVLTQTTTDDEKTQYWSKYVMDPALGKSPICLSLCCTLNFIGTDPRKTDLIIALNKNGQERLKALQDFFNNEMAPYLALANTSNTNIQYCSTDYKYTNDPNTSYSTLYSYIRQQKINDAIKIINHYTKSAPVSDCKSHSDANYWTTELSTSLAAYASSKNITCANVGTLVYDNIEDNWNCLVSIKNKVCEDAPDSSLCKGLEQYITCPKLDNYNLVYPLIGPFVTDIVHKYEAQPSPDEDNCLIDFLTLSFWDHLIGIIPFLEIPQKVTAFFAAIALGVRAITGYVANAFVWSFTGLPKKLGGYVNFAPIYNAGTKTGVWYTMLIFANLGIVLGMIFMAIATIFRLEKYSWKKMLPKLLLVALLVNFSLVIMGIFVDISNYLSMTFLSRSTNNRLGDTIKDVITAVSCPLAGDKQHFVPNMTAVIVATILSGIFLFQFAGLLFYVITRIFTIWICVATAPLAFLGMAIDSEPVKKAVDMWRDRFTQAIVSLPILSFVLYFVLLILQGIGTQLNEFANSGNALDFPMLIAYAVLIIGAAQVLRFVAKSIGVEQIEQGYAFARKAVTGAVMAGGAMVGGFALGRITQSGWYNNLAHGLSAEGAGARGGLGGFVSRGLSTQLYKIKGVSESKRAEKEQKELDTIKNDEAALNNAARNAMALGKTSTVLKIMAMKAKAGLGYTKDERHFMLRLPAQSRHTEDARAIYKYNAALKLDKRGNRIPLDEIINRYKTTPTGDTDVKELIESLEDPILQEQFIRGALGPAKSIQEIADFIQTIPSGDQKDFMDYLRDNVLGKTTLHDYLKGINPTLVSMIDTPDPKTNPQNLSRISLIKRLWNNP